MKTNYKKSLKMSILLVSSLLIASASASYYRYLYISGTVTISAGGLAFVKGVEEAGTVEIDGSTATIALSLNNGTTNNITRHLYLKNLDNNKNYSVTINITDTADSTYYTTFNVIIYDNSTGESIATLNALSTSSSGPKTITGNQVWHITFYIVTKPDVTVTDDTFAIQFTYE
jgi:hypothetical protein